MEKEGVDSLTDLYRNQHLMWILHDAILKHRSRTHELMLASCHRTDPGRSEYDSDLKNWLEQVIENPVQIENGPRKFGQIHLYLGKKSSQGLL